MFCSKCGKEIPNGAKFCSNCGTYVSSQIYQQPPQQQYQQQQYQQPYQSVYTQPKTLLQQLSDKVKVEAIIWISVAGLQYLLGLLFLLFVSIPYGIFLLIIAVLNTLFSVRSFKYCREVLVHPVGIVSKYEPIGGLIVTLIYNILFGGIIGVAGSIYGFVLRSFVMSNRNQFMQIEMESSHFV